MLRCATLFLISSARPTLAGSTYSLFTERDQVINSLENKKSPRKIRKIEQLENQVISSYLGHESFLFQHQKFQLMLFYNRCLNNSFQNCCLPNAVQRLSSIAEFEFEYDHSKLSSCISIQNKRTE